MNPRLIFIYILLSFWIVPFSSAIAHKVIVFAWVENGMIHTESSFGSKRMVQKGQIEVYDAKQTLIHKGITDDKGEYSFKIPENVDSDLLIKLDATTGHQASWTIPESELVSDQVENDIEKAMETKANIEKGPALYKILLGIAAIFLIAMGFQYFFRSRKKDI